MTVYLPAAVGRAACWPKYELPHAACVEYANAFRRMLHMRHWLLTVLACSAAATALAQQPPASSIRVTGDARATAKPDRGQINIGVTTRAALSQAAAAQNSREADAGPAGARQGGGP